MTRAVASPAATFDETVGGPAGAALKTKNEYLRFLMLDNLFNGWSKADSVEEKKETSKRKREEERNMQDHVESPQSLAVEVAGPIEPTEMDVLLGRGGYTEHHPGNKCYLKVKAAMQPRYFASEKTEKTRISQELVNRVHSWGGRFLQHDKETATWYEVANDTARGKASQAMREMYKPEAREAKRIKCAFEKTCESVPVIPVEEEEEDKKKNPSGQCPAIVPTDKDVLLGRGGHAGHHPGNKYYREVKTAMQDRYLAATAVTEKTRISQELVDIVRQRGGRFLKRDKLLGTWYEAENDTARTTAGQALREVNAPGVPTVKLDKYDLEKVTSKRKSVPIELGEEEENPYGLKCPDIVNVLIAPTDKDVLLGRGGHARHHIGNLYYLKVKTDLQDRYFKAKCSEKTRISQELVDIVRGRGGRFLKYNKFVGKWYEVENDMARGKASQALREVHVAGGHATMRVKYGEEKNTPCEA
jgi:hypothetical protein